MEDRSGAINWLMLIGLSFIWGSSFILMKYGLKSFSAGQVAAFRMFTAFLLLLPVSLRHIKCITRKNILSLLIVGFIGNCFPAFMFTIAQTHINSALAGMLNATTPIFTLIIGWIIYKVSSRKIQIIGVGIGFLGAIALIVKDPANLEGSGNWYALFILLATTMYGININHVKSRLQDLTGVQISSIAFFLVGPAVGIYLLFSGLPERFAQPDAWHNFVYVIILGTMSSAVAVTGVNILIQRTSALFSSSVTYIIPIFAILWGLFDGEVLTPIQFLGMGAVMLGVYLVNKRVKK